MLLSVGMLIIIINFAESTYLYARDTDYKPGTIN